MNDGHNDHVILMDFDFEVPSNWCLLVYLDDVYVCLLCIMVVDGSPPDSLFSWHFQKAEGMNKELQEHLGIIEERRRKLFLKVRLITAKELVFVHERVLSSRALIALSLHYLQREQLGEEEFLFEKYGYSYDWVFVFPIGEEPDSEAFQVLML